MTEMLWFRAALCTMHVDNSAYDFGTWKVTGYRE
jgi:hypothetical protein